MTSPRQRRALSLLVSMLMIVSLLPASSAGAAGSSISGRVFDAKTGAGMPCKVVLFKKVSFSDPIGGAGQEWRAVARGFANSSGEWTISKYTTSDLPEIIDTAPDLPAGTYRVGFVPYSIEYTREIYDNVMDYDVWAGRDVVVGPGQAVTGIDAGLSSGWGYVGGKVTDAQTGKPLAGVRVYVEYWSPSLNDWQQWTRDDTAADGTFRTERLPEGTYRVRYWDLNGLYAQSFWPGTPVEASAQTVAVTENLTTNCSIALERRSVLKGRVTATVTAEPVADIEVTAYRYDSLRDSWAWDARTYTDSRGAYALSVNGSGQYRLEYRDWSGSYALKGDDYISFYPGVSKLSDAAVFGLSANQVVQNVDCTITPSASTRFARIGAASAAVRSAGVSFQSFAASETTYAVMVNPSIRGAVAVAPALAGALRAPVLYCSPTAVSSPVMGELSRLGTKRVYLIGSSTHVTSRVVSQLQAAGIAVTRVSGSDSYRLSVATLMRVKRIRGARYSRRVIVANASRPTDIGAAAALAYRLNAPIMLTSRDGLPVGGSYALKSTGTNTAILVGSSAYLSSTLVTRLRASGVTSLTRRYGSTPAHTAASIASYGVAKRWSNYCNVGIAGSTSGDLPDMALAGVYAGKRRGSLLLTTPITVPTPTSAPLSKYRTSVTGVRVIAAPTSVSTSGLIRLSNLVY